MLHAFFFDTAARCPDAPALWVQGHHYSYRDLELRALRIASALAPFAAGAGAYCLLFANRSMPAYAGLLGALKSGMAYVPVHPRFPEERNATIAARTGAGVILAERRHLAELAAMLRLLPPDMQVILLDDDARPSRPTSAARLVTADARPLPAPAAASYPTGMPAPIRTQEDLAYLIFTSGSSGPPKGVMISHASAVAYVQAQREAYPCAPGARYSQFADLTFDFSVHDMYVCWANAGCLYVPAVQDPLYLADFIREHQITHWASVPSVLALMQQFRKLAPGAFPSLRETLLGGEALPKAMAQAWAAAAPNSRIINAYGPTETTVIVLTFVLGQDFLRDAASAAVPLGHPHSGVETVVVDANLDEVPAGARGELLIGGQQLARGYLGANAEDQARFLARRYAGRRCRRWYRSGDLVSAGSRGILYHGRIDHQVKVRGNRIELMEIEQVVQSTGCVQCAVLAWPLDESGKPEGLVVVLQGSTQRAAKREALILATCRRLLPPYARPDRFVYVDDFPITPNGKINRAALMAHCDALDTRAGALQS